MDARIVDGRKIAKVTSEGRLLVEPTVLRGTYGGEPVAVQVTADGELVISAAVHVGDVTATIGEIEAKGSPDDGVTWVPVRVDADGRLEVQLSENKASRVQTVLTTTPLGANKTYTQSGVDAEEWVGAGGTGAIVVSGLARADKPGTLFLEVSHDNATWTIWDAALANSTGTARLKPITLPLKYFRFKYVNGSEAQTSFALIQNIMQDGDGRGGEHGQGSDNFIRYGNLAAGTTEVLLDLRSPVEIMYLMMRSNSKKVGFELTTYKDDGSPITFNWVSSDGSVPAVATSEYINGLGGHPYFENMKYDTSGNIYAIQKRPEAPGIFARGLRLSVRSLDTVDSGSAVACGVRLL